MQEKQDKTSLIDWLSERGYIKSKAVEQAFLKVPREDFVLDGYEGMVYNDNPQPILAGQTISAPSMIAIMLEAAKLKKGLKVLEVGAGSGYNAALLAELVGHENIITIERIPELVGWAKKNLKKAGYENIRVIHGDGSLGYEEEAPYDRIVVTAGAPKISKAWVKQLKKGGMIIAPVGGKRFYQTLRICKKGIDGRVKSEARGECAFVPLVGKEAWPG